MGISASISMKGHQYDNSLEESRRSSEFIWEFYQPVKVVTLMDGNENGLLVEFETRDIINLAKLLSELS